MMILFILSFFLLITKICLIFTEIIERQYIAHIYARFLDQEGRKEGCGSPAGGQTSGGQARGQSSL